MARGSVLAALVAASLLAAPVRVLAAADVVAHVVDGALVIHGSQDDDTFYLRGGADPGSFVLTPFDTDNTINGSTEPVTLSGITGAVVIDTGDGWDWVAIEMANLPGDLTVHTGRGDDSIDVYQSQVLGRTRLFGGRDPDNIAPVEAHFVGDVRVDTGAEADTFQPEDSVFEGRLVVNLRGGEDEAVFVRSTMEAVQVRNGRDDDSTIWEQSTFHGPASFRGGPGFDFLDAFAPNAFAAEPTVRGYELIESFPAP